MNGKADDLIGTLVHDLRPVRRLRPPLLRAGAWLLLFAAAATLAIVRWSDWTVFEQRLAAVGLQLELLGALATGVAAIAAAFSLSIPGRSQRWRLAPLPGLLLWVLGSGSECLPQLGNGAWDLRGSLHCFVFITAVSLPAAALLLAALRRARPLTPRPVAALAALGAAALAAVLLQFFHPFDENPTDALLHFAAVLCVVAVASGLGRPMLAVPPPLRRSGRG